MAKAKVPKTKIQAYFTHPDRPVNFGRITNIEKDQYGRGIPAASSQEVDAFVEQWNETRGSRVEAVAGAALGALSSPLAPEAIGALFEAKRQAWFVRDGETEILECKKSFHLSGRVFRAVAALANNRGGYVIFGVKDEGYEVVGLDNDKFATLDKNIFSQAISAAMEPLPRFEITHTQINKMMVGVMFVHPEPDRPVIATKNDQDFKEGTIYYRYPGESRAIRAAEFRRILADRDRQARLEANQSLRKILELGRNAAVLDLESGRIDGVANSIMIDEGLLSKIQFVREGEFVEKKGTPALRLVGEVRAIGQLAPSHGPLKIVREAVDEADVLRNFVRQELVELPIAYLFRSCHTAKRWLPIFYYAKMSRLPLKEIRSLIVERETSHVASKRHLLERIDGTRTARTVLSGRGKIRLDQLVSGKFKAPKKAIDASYQAYTLSALPRASLKLGDALDVLRSCIDAAREDPEMKPVYWSNIYRAAARIDELYFREKN